MRWGADGETTRDEKEVKEEWRIDGTLTQASRSADAKESITRKNEERREEKARDDAHGAGIMKGIRKRKWDRA